MFGLFKKKKIQTPVSQPMILRARYDAAQTTTDNERHWSSAEAGSADALANPHVRRILRNRARNEYANDSYAKGIVSTVANDVVGTGPRLQIVGKSKGAADRIEKAWETYAKSIDLAGKLRVLRASRAISGECFVIQFVNPRLQETCQVDLRIIEPDYVAGTILATENNGYYDGIYYDSFGHPTAYDVLKSHPGDVGSWTILAGESDTLDASVVFHYYKIERPGQRRGVPEITPALPLFAYRRRYALATIAAAETAANHAAVVHSDAPADSDGGTTLTPFDVVELERNSGTVLPGGWNITQLKAEQPTTTYQMFTNAILSELGRCLDVPFTIAALDSSESNMSAAYMDQHAYAKARTIERHELNTMLDWLFSAWWMWMRSEAGKFNGEEPQHQWFWPQLGQHADPNKVANAQKIQLASGTTSLAREFAKQGLDVEAEMESAAKSLGLTLPEYQEKLCASLFNNGNINPDTTEESGNSSPQPAAVESDE